MNSICSSENRSPPWTFGPRITVVSIYSAAFSSDAFTGSRMVTNSSAAVGWMPTVASKTCLVASALIEEASPSLDSERPD